MNTVVLILMLPFFIPILLAFIFILKIFLKGKAEGWKGEVVDKTHNSKRGSFEDSGKIEEFYTLKVKMETGQIRNIAVSSLFYDDCAVGDKIEKLKGAIYPVKVTA